jgi:hypothetical protein
MTAPPPKASPTLVLVDADAVIAGLSTADLRAAFALSQPSNPDGPELLAELHDGAHVVYADTWHREAGRYRVELLMFGEPWRGSCTCPAAGLCVHLAAVAIIECRDRMLAARVPA